MCYYNVLRAEASAGSVLGEAQSRAEEHLVCFVRAFDQADQDLDLFRSELDQFCGKVLEMQELQPTGSDQIGLDSPLAVYLSGW